MNAADIIALSLTGDDPHMVMHDAVDMAENALAALHAAGYAVVKLPEPDLFENNDPVWQRSCTSVVDGEVWDDQGCPMDPLDARGIALDLLAAAEYAERAGAGDA